ncbi:MAG: hypothetical protein Kow0068_17430 [Marinilabiliales bacterium]
MLINLSNHPSDKWSKKQKDKALETYQNIVDIDFPAINPNWDTKEIIELSKKYYSIIMNRFKEDEIINETNAVHIMGELTFTYHLIRQLKSSGITCIASTTVRNVEEKNGKKIVEFNFVRFREY